MNFDQWIKKYNEENLGSRYSYSDIMATWEGCKQEVLKIMTDKLNNIGWTANPEIVEMMRQIERL